MHHGFAVAGICLIRLEEIRPLGFPRIGGISSENAAHRVAVLWDEPSGEQQEGVFIPRRDTSSCLNHWAGGRLFPGEHYLADFEVRDDGFTVELSVRARDGGMTVEVRGKEAAMLPTSSCFQSLPEASSFFEAGSVGYSTTACGSHFDGIRLDTERWAVRPFEVELVNSSFFADERLFPKGSVSFDHALLMRDLPHRWCTEPAMPAMPPRLGDNGASLNVLAH